ncbi:MAG: ABC transporter permease [Bacteroidetes bacterium]|nr:ABC transporter permease [Bacteroidota bacterium]
MNAVWIILSREYLSRVKKKSFIIMTILGPILVALFYGLIGYVASRESDSEVEFNVLLRDASGNIANRLNHAEGYRFTPTSASDDSVRHSLIRGAYAGFLNIRDRDVNVLDSVEFIAMELPGPAQKRVLERSLDSLLHADKLKEAGLSQGFLDSLKTPIRIQTLELGKDGSMVNSIAEVRGGMGFLMAAIIYIFIFMYGVMVMRSVQEEKSNRIVEILVSSVKPFHLMLGKIFGIALVALTQFVIWVALSGGLLVLLSGVIGMPNAGPGPEGVPLQTGGLPGIMQAFMALPFLKMGGLFLFYFLGGYLLYASFLAAIGAAVDQETDTQQFMFPVTIPLVFAFVIASRVAFDDPNSSLAVWTSIIPFTSPIVMVVRSAFDVPWWQLLLSMGSLLLTFLLMVWISGKIYRTGLLLYGKKVSWKELFKWLWYKD